MGANIKGAGTNIIKIEGVKALKGCNYTIIPDRIEAGTYMVAAAMTNGDVYIENALSEHLKPVIAKLKEAGVFIQEEINGIPMIPNPKSEAWLICALKNNSYQHFLSKLMDITPTNIICK